MIRMYWGTLRAYGRKRKPMPRQLESDWFRGSIPDNVLLGPDVYIDSTFGLAAFFSERNPGLQVGRASGLYDRATLIVGQQGVIDIGDFVCLNGVYLICNQSIDVGSHSLLGWGSIIT